METELVKTHYNEKVKFDPSHPQSFEFPDFTLLFIAPQKARYIGLGGPKEYTSYRFTMKSNGFEKEISLSVGPEKPVPHLSSPRLINEKLFVFEVGRSETRGDLADDEFVVHPSRKEEVEGSHHVHL